MQDMNKISHVILISLFSLTVISSCNESSDDSNSTSTMNDPNNTTPVTFTENLHSSLPEEWVTEYNTIKEKLLNIFPLYQKYYHRHVQRNAVIYLQEKIIQEM